MVGALETWARQQAEGQRAAEEYRAAVEAAWAQTAGEAGEEARRIAEQRAAALCPAAPEQVIATDRHCLFNRALSRAATDAHCIAANRHVAAGPRLQRGSVGASAVEADALAGRGG